MRSLTCAAIATRLDEEMLAARPALIYPPQTPTDQMPDRDGCSIADELGGRFLLRYLLAAQYGAFSLGARGLQFVTPTPYSPADTVAWLALPNPAKRPYLLVLDPSKIEKIRGPRRIRFGGGLEYLLTDGFPSAALVLPWPVQIS